MRTAAALLAVMLACGAPAVMAGQQNTNGQDVPKEQPGANNPDLSQQKMDGKGSSGRSSAVNPPDSKSSTQDSSSTKKRGKKKHNPQTHGAQKHRPDNQS